MQLVLRILVLNLNQTNRFIQSYVLIKQVTTDEGNSAIPLYKPKKKELQ